jgi:TIR domain
MDATAADPFAMATYDVCLSFAGAQRSYVDRVHSLLVEAGLTVFYDNAETVRLWSGDLPVIFDAIYRERSRFCVIFTSLDYLTGMWTLLERRSALSRMAVQRGSYLLPVRFDDTEILGIPTTMGYIDARRKDALELAELIIEKVTGESARESAVGTVLAMLTDPVVEGVANLVWRALAEEGLALPDGHVEHRDRALVVPLPNTLVSPNRVIGTVVPAIARTFEKHAPAHANLLIGVHVGEYDREDERWRGIATAAASSLARTPSVAAVLAATEHGRCVIALSDRCHTEITAPGSGVNSSVFHRIDPFSPIWVSVPGYPRPPLPGDAPPTQAPSAGPADLRRAAHAMTFIGNTNIDQIGDRFYHGGPGNG